MILNAKQNHVLDLVLNGENVFITGGAGVGKSFITNHIRKSLEATGNVVKVTVEE